MNPFRKPSVLLLALSLLSCQVVWADVVTLRSGVGSSWQRNRDTDENTRYASLLTEMSYLSPAMEISLELPLRWDSENWELDKETWSRKGDMLRPVRAFLYSPANRTGGTGWKAGLEVFHSWTPGQGHLVRDLSGAGEIDYVLPGVRLQWQGERLKAEAGIDRPVDPSVQAMGLSYRVSENLVLFMEGASDPEAPLSFSGKFQDGRPEADATDQVTGAAAGLELKLRNGDVLDLYLGTHAARLGEDGEGIGGDLSFSFDFSSYYRNRLLVKVGKVLCREGYIPAWFDGAYSILRWGGDTQPILSLYPLDQVSPERRMEMVEIRYDLGELFSIMGGVERFDDDSMSKARFDLALREESGRGLEANIWTRVDGPDGTLFSVDSNMYSRLSALYDLSPHFLLRASLVRSWAFDEELGDLAPLNSALMGVMYNISF